MSAISLISFLILLCHLSVGWSKKYEDGYKDILNELKTSGKKLSWTPTLNQQFVGKDLEELQKKHGGIRDDLHEAYKKNPLLSDEKPSLDKIWLKHQHGGNKQNDPIRIKRQSENNVVTIPASFDWRNVSKCQSLRDIPDQQCGDCWAVSSAIVASDRYCLVTDKNVIISARHISGCTMDPAENGCDGGYPSKAFEKLRTQGFGTGGDLTAKQAPGCLAYPQVNYTNTNTCPLVCDNGDPIQLYYGGPVNTSPSKNVTAIQYEILTQGPVTAIIDSSPDLYYYGKNAQQSGIYDAQLYPTTGRHAVRLLGWGEEKGVPYWLGANSWSSQWGPFAGYFKILRGSNFVSVEETVVAPYMKVAFAAN